MSKVSSFTQSTTFSGDELVYIVDDPAGTPVDRHTTVALLEAHILTGMVALADFTDADVLTLTVPASTTISTFGATLVDDANAAAARATLELGDMALETAADYVAKATFPVEIIVALSDETTAITTTGEKVSFRSPYAFTLTGVRASVSTAATSGTLTIDINESGSTVLSTKLTIDANELTSTTAATAAVIGGAGPAIADDAEITMDVDNVANSLAKGLKVVLYGTRNVA